MSRPQPHADIKHQDDQNTSSDNTAQALSSSSALQTVAEASAGRGSPVTVTQAVTLSAKEWQSLTSMLDVTFNKYGIGTDGELCVLCLPELRSVSQLL